LPFLTVFISLCGIVRKFNQATHIYYKVACNTTDDFMLQAVIFITDLPETNISRSGSVEKKGLIPAECPLGDYSKIEWHGKVEKLKFPPNLNPDYDRVIWSKLRRGLRGTGTLVRFKARIG
jgi:hypothetical protein